MVVIATALWRVFIGSPFVCFDPPSRLICLRISMKSYLAHGDDCHSFGCSTIGVSLIFLSTFPTRSGYPEFPDSFFLVLRDRAKRWMNLAREYYKPTTRKSEKKQSSSQAFGGGRLIEVTPDRAVHLRRHYRDIDTLLGEGRRANYLKKQCAPVAQ